MAADGSAFSTSYRCRADVCFTCLDHLSNLSLEGVAQTVNDTSPAATADSSDDTLQSADLLTEVQATIIALSSKGFSVQTVSSVLARVAPTPASATSAARAESPKTITDSAETPKVVKSAKAATISKKRDRDEDEDEVVDKPFTKIFCADEDGIQAAGTVGDESFASRTPSPPRSAAPSTRVSRAPSATSTANSSGGTPPPAADESGVDPPKTSSAAATKKDDTAPFPPMVNPPVGVRMTMFEFRQRTNRIRDLKAQGAGADDERRRVRDWLGKHVGSYGLDVPDPVERAKLYVGSFKEKDHPMWDNC